LTLVTRVPIVAWVPADALTAICAAYPDRIEVRGRDLCGDLMGHVGFTEYFYLLLTGKEPAEEQRYFLDLLLVSIAEHGLTPTNVAARMTYAAAPESLQGAVAAGILGCGTVVLGTSELCALLLEEAQAKVAAGASPADVARETAVAVRTSGGKMPGFGHPLHRPVDPRTVRILELADERGVSGPHVRLARELEPAVADAWGRALTMNVQMPIAAVLLDLGFPASAAKAIPLLARTAGLLAHLAEEQQRPIGFLMAARAEAEIAYEPGQPTGA
jgi:citrate synthase